MRVGFSQSMRFGTVVLPGSQRRVQTSPMFGSTNPYEKLHDVVLDTIAADGIRMPMILDDLPRSEVDLAWTLSGSLALEDAEAALAEFEAPASQTGQLYEEAVAAEAEARTAYELPKTAYEEASGLTEAFEDIRVLKQKNKPKKALLVVGQDTKTGLEFFADTYYHDKNKRMTNYLNKYQKIYYAVPQASAQLRKQVRLLNQGSLSELRTAIEQGVATKGQQEKKGQPREGAWRRSDANHITDNLPGLKDKFRLITLSQ